MPQAQLDELDYLTQITFELYERARGIGNEDAKEFSVRVSFTSGSYSAELVDLKMDDRHAIAAAARKDITDHISLDELLSKMRKLLEDGATGTSDESAPAIGK